MKERDPKHQNSINPLRRSLKGFLKADAHHTEAFQVNTVCGGNAAEAFMLYALTFPLCYFLFLHLSHAVFPSPPLGSLSLSFIFCISACISLLFWHNIHSKLDKPEKAAYEQKELAVALHQIVIFSLFFVHKSQMREILEEINDNSCAHWLVVLTFLWELFIFTNL